MPALTQEQLYKPLNMAEAARVLTAHYPQYAADRFQVRRLCTEGYVTHRAEGSGKRRCLYVRVADLFTYFRANERVAVQPKRRGRKPAPLAMPASACAMQIQVGQSGGATHIDAQFLTPSWTA